MSTKVDTGFRFVAHQMHPITAMIEAVTGVAPVAHVGLVVERHEAL